MKFFKFITVLLFCSLLSACASERSDMNLEGKKILFINASMNKDGNTAKFARELLSGRKYEQLDLIDYRINFLGQKLAGDQFEQVYEKMASADVLIIGTPVYWHTLAAPLKTLMDRIYEKEGANKLSGKGVIFIAQGFDPVKITIEQMDYMMERFTKKYDMVLLGKANTMSEIRNLKSKFKGE